MEPASSLLEKISLNIDIPKDMLPAPIKTILVVFMFFLVGWNRGSQDLRDHNRSLRSSHPAVEVYVKSLDFAMAGMLAADPWRGSSGCAGDLFLEKIKKQMVVGCLFLVIGILEDSFLKKTKEN